MMGGTRWCGALAAVLVACLGFVSHPGVALGQAATNQELQNKLKDLQQRLDELNKELKAVQE